MKKILIIILAINLSLFISASNTNTEEEYPEISSEEFAEFEAKYINESDGPEKKYLEAVVRPEKFDLNKDRRISKEELREALVYVTYPKDQKSRKTIPDEVDEHIRNNIDLYVRSINLNKLTFRQFSYAMRKVSLTHFMSMDALQNRLKAKEEKREPESDL